MMYQYPDYMYHYGVKGMKWGVRKSRVKSSKSKKRGISDRSIRKDRLKASKSRRKLSDSELDARIKRLEKEKKLRTLTEEEINPGRTMVKNQLKKVGAAAVAGGAVVGARYVMTGKFNVQEAANFIFPNPNKKK